jgi:hypothetical protein
VNFGTWHALGDAPAAAPEAAGVLQARADAVRSYPRGRSAMVYYAGCRAGETLRRYVAGRGAPGLARAAGAGARWVRFGADDAPERALARLLGQFVDRFGAPPAANATDDEDGGVHDG